MQVSFICPLAAGLRPITPPASSRVEVEEERAPRHLRPGRAGVLRGRTGVPVLIERSSMPAVFVRLGRSDFYRRIREKIKLGFEV